MNLSSRTLYTDDPAINSALEKLVFTEIDAMKLYDLDAYQSLKEQLNSTDNAFGSTDSICEFAAQYVGDEIGFIAKEYVGMAI